ncbi:Adenosyl-chloride synthase [Rosistilla oblonga]|uniref:SAM hydrolase/SAM-dependent halogenase family protein n=1 Tax=Rosistilla oblonga TaxID=2527990 RepID=UPI00118B8583|nr:SAM-dependent chlorinase/fluorinase [Rosistilla oblonga]QDV10495.1 Adenosyl-chloride synthase [Rosistilla oblonga]
MSIITLLTDFGVSSPYVAQIKGVLATRQPESHVIDLTHSVPPQNVQTAAITLDDLAPWFPSGAVHVAVVDPGVGSDRRILAAHVGDWYFVLPDNGLISPLADRFAVKSVVALDRREFWLSPVSNTFHGRDVMAPVAAAIARGVPLEELGESVDDWHRVHIPRPCVMSKSIQGEVIYVDSFGNLITNISADDVHGDDVFRIGDRAVNGLVRSYSDRTAGQLVALIGSSGRLEFAVVDGNAAVQLGAGQGAAVGVDLVGETQQVGDSQ